MGPRDQGSRGHGGGDVWPALTSVLLSVETSHKTNTFNYDLWTNRLLTFCFTHDVTFCSWAASYLYWHLRLWPFSLTECKVKSVITARITEILLICLWGFFNLLLLVCSAYVIVWPNSVQISILSLKWWSQHLNSHLAVSRLLLFKLWVHFVDSTSVLTLVGFVFQDLY